MPAPVAHDGSVGNGPKVRLVASRDVCHSAQNERSFSFLQHCMPKVSPAHEQQRRDQILAAAMRCFARQGYHATSMDDVVRECGLSVGAIYTYFSSKEDLFLALAEARSEQTLAYLSDLFRRPGPMADKANEAIDYFFQH